MSAISARFNALPANLRGVLWVLVGSVFFSLNDMTVKLLGPSIHPVEMAWFRYIVGFVLLMPVFMRLGVSGLRTERLPLHFGRAIIAGIGQAGIYYAVVHLMLADATALSFSRALFITLLAAFLLKESVRWPRWVATLVGFVGVLIMLRPGAGTIDPASLVGLGSAAMFAFGLIIIRHLSKTESPNQILFYYHLIGIVLFAGPAIYVWKTPQGVEWLLLFMIGALTCLAMSCFVRGFAVGEASTLGPIEYIRLIYAAALGYLVFSEVPDIWTWVGAGVIVASTYAIARQEARKGAA